ncbi:hypothetical protein EJ110_NYTH54277 [Nymphaea thermarum]|nr:hypothetical protein EJ110_NYTH54277 [Nymphaea thermarum]
MEGDGSSQGKEKGFEEPIPSCEIREVDVERQLFIPEVAYKAMVERFDFAAIGAMAGNSGMVGKGNFIIRTNSEEEINAILAPGAWRVGITVLIANRWRPGQPIKVEATNRVSIWIRLPDFPEMRRDKVFEDLRGASTVSQNGWSKVRTVKFNMRKQVAKETQATRANRFEELGGEDHLPPSAGNEEGEELLLCMPRFSPLLKIKPRKPYMIHIIGLPFRKFKELLREIEVNSGLVVKRDKGIWMEGWSQKRDSCVIIQIVTWERNNTMGLAAMVKLRNGSIILAIVK